MKKIRVSLLTKVVIAIAAGVLFGQFLPGGIARIFVTFNSLFGNFLSFSIPLIILGLVTPAIGDLGKGAGKLLLITALIAYGSTVFSGFFTFLSGSGYIPAHTTDQHGIDGDGESGRFHADTLLRGKYAAFNGCHDSLAAILYDWPRAF